MIGVAPEFGTVMLNEMLGVLIEENAWWQSGCRSGPDRRAAIGRMMDCFCPAIAPGVSVSGGGSNGGLARRWNF